MYYKYPRTSHLPWSEGATDDDRRLDGVEHFVGKIVVVSEKLDGENTSGYADHYHARSVDSGHHPSRSRVKSLHASIAHQIPEGWRICGENVFALHSIAYTELEAYFYVFGIYDEHNVCLSWSDTVDVAKMLGLPTVPVLFQGVWDEEAVKACYTGDSLAGGAQEGYVVRTADAFHYDQHNDCVGKFVRKNHVQTSEHWKSQPVVPNLLKEDVEHAE